MKNNAEKLKKNIVQFSNNGITGKIRIKLFGGNIVYLDKTEKVLPIEKVEAKTSIPIDMCLRFVSRFEQENIFGELNFSIIDGRITEIKVKRIYKLRDIEKFLSDSK